jgi:hypothetical protein
LELLLLVLVVVWLELGLKLLVLFLGPRKLGRVRDIRIVFAVGSRSWIVGWISLAGPQLRARVNDDNMALFKVLHEGMEVLEVETAARVVAALWGKGNRSLSNDEKAKAWG